MKITAVVAQPFRENCAKSLEKAVDALVTVKIQQVIVVGDTKRPWGRANFQLLRKAKSWPLDLVELQVDRYGTAWRWYPGIVKAIELGATHVLNFPGDIEHVATPFQFENALQQLVLADEKKDLVLGDWSSSDDFKQNYFDKYVFFEMVRSRHVWPEEHLKKTKGINLSKNRTEIFRISAMLFERFRNNFRRIWSYDPTPSLLLEAFRKAEEESTNWHSVTGVFHFGNFADSPTTRDVHGQTDQIVRFCAEMLRSRIVELAENYHLPGDISKWSEQQKQDYQTAKIELRKAVKHVLRTCKKAVRENFKRLDRLIDQ